MAGKILGLVFDHYHGDAVCKLVLLTLADRADHLGKCWPSRADLAARSGASTATVGRKLRQLERLGWIQRSARFQASTVFRINVARLLDFADLAAMVQPVPGGFEPFPEEKARAERLRSAQVIENQKDDHSDRKDDHSDRKDDHLSDQLTTNNLRKNLTRRPAPKAGKVALPKVVTPWIAGQFAQGKAVVWGSELVGPGDAAWREIGLAVKEKGL